MNLIRALSAAGTASFYVDTADEAQLRALAGSLGTDTLQGLSGVTMNQAFVESVVTRYAHRPKVPAGREKTVCGRGEMAIDESELQAYGDVCTRIAMDLRMYARDKRKWLVHVPLHLGIGGNLSRARSQGLRIRGALPEAVMKIAFMPHEAGFLLVVRDLERAGIPVNVTCAFSLRQAMTVALLTNAPFVSIFMGRINRGTQKSGLGERVVAETQALLSRIRRDEGVKTQLVVAAVRNWQDIVSVAGCDAITTFPDVISAFFKQEDVKAPDIRNRIIPYGQTTAATSRVAPTRGAKNLAADSVLYEIEPEYLDFLLTFRRTPEYLGMREGNELVTEFSRRGWNDMFYVPTRDEWSVISRSRIPDFEAPLSRRLSLDTLFSLLAYGDFWKYQVKIDEKIGIRSQSSSLTGGYDHNKVIPRSDTVAPTNQPVL